MYGNLCIYIYTCNLVKIPGEILSLLFIYVTLCGWNQKGCRTQRVIIQTTDITVYLSATSLSFVPRTKGEIGGAK